MPPVCRVAYNLLTFFIHASPLLLIIDEDVALGRQVISVKSGTDPSSSSSRLQLMSNESYEFYYRYVLLPIHLHVA
jgi:hypothetical protein